MNLSVKEKQLRDLQIEVRAERAKELEEKLLPKFKDLVGSVWAFRNNSYSCPSEPSDYWDVFKKITAVKHLDGYWQVIFFEFQTDKHGEITINPENAQGLQFVQLDSLERITDKEFKLAWEKLRRYCDND